MMKIASGFSVFPIAFLMVTALALGPLSARAEVVDLSGMYVLQNGLDVRLMPDPGTPVVAALVLVRTGYADEGRSRSGFSHLLEHLVFAGTQKRTKYEIQREVDNLGGYVNGFTRDDFTGYLIVGHRDHLDRLLDILADMLFNSTIPEEGVREAKAVVLEEILRSRSRPESGDAERFQALLYEGSPYAKTGLGNETTVTASTREEIENFYRRTYRPDNMILLLRGGFNTAKAQDAVSGAFGPAVMGAQKEPAELPEPILADRVYRVQAEIPDVRVRIGFNGPRPRNRDSQVLELLAGTLGGDGGILDRALASAGFQPRSVLAYLSVNEGFTRFIITSQFPAGTDPSAVRSVMLESVKAFIDMKSLEEEMNRTRRSMVSAEIMGREKLHYFLMGKAQWIISGSPGQGLSPGRWDNITADDLRDAVLKYVTGKPSVSLFTVPGMNGQVLEKTAAPVKAEVMLDNGLQVVAEQRPGSEVFALHLMTRSRSAVEPENREGIADFLHRLLPRGTASRTREELSDELRSLGASLSTAGDPTVPFGDFYTSRLYSYIRLECVMEAAYEAVPLLADMVQNPLLAESEVEDVRKQIIDFISYRDASPGSLALRVLGGILYGEGLGSDVYGTRESIGSITVQDLADFHKRYLTGKNMIISVVSGMKPEESVALVKKAFNDLQTGESPAEPAIHLTFEPELVEMNLGKAQGAIAAGAVTGVIGKRNTPALAVASALLNTRLVEQLREKEGFAYSVGGSLGVVGDRVVFTMSMGTSPDKIERARESIKDQVKAAMEAEITPEDMEREINRLVGRLQMRMLSSINRAYYLGLAARNGAAHTYGEDYRNLLLDLTPEDIKQVTRKYLTGDTLVEVVVH